MGAHNGRVAWVTGGSKGIGRGVAFALARQGSAVVVHGRTREPAEQTAAEIADFGGSAIAVWGPIDDEDTSRIAIEVAQGRYGRLDTLVTAASIHRYGDVPATTRDVWDEVFAVNVTGVFLAARAALPLLRARGNGSIVVVSSVEGVAALPQVAAYTAGNGALIAFARSLAVDEAQHGVRVNSVLPGHVDIEAHDPVGTPSEIGEVVAFLTSSRASFVTGAEVRVDGGLLGRLPVSGGPRRSP